VARRKLRSELRAADSSDGDQAEYQGEESARPIATLVGREIEGGVGAGSPEAVGSVTTWAPASLRRRWNSGEARMMVPAAARRRSTAASGSMNVVGRLFRYS